MSISEQRIEIIKEIGALELRAEKGENVTAKIRHCGKRLEALGKQRKRKDVMDAEYEGMREKEITDGILSKKQNEADYKKWMTVAIESGVGINQYGMRVTRGWSFEKAATQPLRKKKANKERVNA